MRIRLTALLAALLLIFAAVSVTAIVNLVKIDRQVETINRKWLAGTQLLGDLKNTVSEFRVAQGYRFLAVDQPGVIQAEFLAERQAKIVGDLIARFERMASEVDMVDDCLRFEATWKDLLGNHRAWIDEASGEQITKPMGYGSAIQKRYEAVQLAANNLIDDARAAADAEVAAANRSATRVTVLVGLLSAVAGLLGIGLMIYGEMHVARPLGAITTALTQLADGDRRVRVPELHRRDEIGAMATAFEVFRRNAVALGEAQEKAEALARHDALTGLANRRLFSTRLETALKATVGGLAAAVILIDLDRFKPINDLHGHAMGDRVLGEVAGRLRGLTGLGTLVARLGGDEFAIIMPPSRDGDAATEQAGRLAGRVVERLSEPMLIMGTHLTIGASIGIAILPADGETAAEVLRTADLGMYRAKRDGRGRYRFFEPSLDADLRARAQLEADLRGALEAREIAPCYQPIVALASGRVVGYEVRAEWRHPGRGIVPPEVFVPLLDQSGGLAQMTEVILRKALEEAAGWEPSLHLAVDVPPRQVEDLAFPSTVAGLLLATGFPPGRLEIEVSDAGLGEDLAATVASLDALRTLGVRVVLGDFGKGRSSLSNMRSLPFDKIKIGPSFVGSVTRDANSAAIVDAIVRLARNFNVPVVAEGIDTVETGEQLVRQGCGFGQGSLFTDAGDLAAATAAAGRQASA